MAEASIKYRNFKTYLNRIDDITKPLQKQYINTHLKKPNILIETNILNYFGHEFLKFFTNTYMNLKQSSNSYTQIHETGDPIITLLFVKNV